MKLKIAIIGGGAAGLFFATQIDTSKYEVSLYEKNSQLGRKLLVAGKGGFNLSHSEPIASLVERYTPSSFLKPALLAHDNTLLRTWFDAQGISTYIGTSGRLFPTKEFKPIMVLNAIISAIKKNGVQIYTDHLWLGESGLNKLSFKHQNQTLSKEYDIIVYALGGGSWKVTGSDGSWLSAFNASHTLPFQASNCAFKVNWSQELLSQVEGKPLKNIQVNSGSSTKKGELIITKFGLEGSPIYALSPEIRSQLTHHNTAEIKLDLKPDLSLSTIKTRLNQSRSKSWTAHIQEVLKLPKSKLKLLKAYTDYDTFNDADALAKTVKKLSIPITGLAPIDEAISTVGGIDLKAVNAHYMYCDRPNHFFIGEMLDWDAPTGGYLIQACFSMGFYLANYLNQKIT